MTDLMQRMRDGVPDAPDLDGLAERAETDARQHRGRRRGVAMAAVATVTAVAIVAPRVIDRSDPPLRGTERPPLTDTLCVGPGNLDHEDFTQGTAEYVRFCPAPPTSEWGAALVPFDVLVNGAAQLVASWQDDVQAYPETVSCPYDPWATEFRVQIGFSDGTVEQLGGQTNSCLAHAFAGEVGVWDGSRISSSLMTELAAQVRGPSGPDRTDLTCPPELGDIADGPEVGAPTKFFAREGLVCEYEFGSLASSGPLSAESSEKVRLTALGQWRPSNRLVDCGRQSGPTLVTYLRTRGGDAVLWVMQGGCQTLFSWGPAPTHFLGEPSPNLVRELKRALVVDY